MVDSAAEPQGGARLKAQTERGPLDVVVTAVDADTVTVDGNHPLAGRPFRARVEVVDVRLATPEELQFGIGLGAARASCRPGRMAPCLQPPNPWPPSCWSRCPRSSPHTLGRASVTENGVQDGDD